MNVIADSFRVAWIDMRYVRRNIVAVIVTTSVVPLLYMFAFGFGLGKGMTVDGMDYLAFMIPGIIALSTLTGCFNTVATKVMLQRNYYQSFDELYLCSMRPVSIVLGKSYMGVIRGLISCAVLYTVGMIVCKDIRIVPTALLLIVFSCMIYSLLGVVSGLLANSHIALNLFNTLAVLPMTFFCGTIFSLDALPLWLADAIGVLPLTQSTACIRASMLGTEFPWISLLGMIVFFALFLSVSCFIMIKRRS